MEFATIFYCLRFGTSLFVASYDSQGGSIRPHLHMGRAKDRISSEQYIYIFSLNLTGNTLRLQYKDQPVNAV
jgi:hypothetical protein